MHFRLRLLPVLLSVFMIISAAAAQGNAALRSYYVGGLPVIGSTPAGQNIFLGGFSGLFYEGRDESGRLRFITHVDRGPNADEIDIDGDGVEERPFALPYYQLEWIRLLVDPADGAVVITERIGLTQPDGSPLLGLPNQPGAAGLAHTDEIPIDLTSQHQPYAPLGADLEGIVRAPDGTYWMGDEYRPSLYHFDAGGRMLARFVPEGAAPETGTPALPAVFGQRRTNRGFEGIAYADGKVYAFLQSPLDNPDVPNDRNSRNARSVRILEFDPASGTTTGQYLYILDSDEFRIGDAAALGGGEFLVLERDENVGAGSFKRVFRISLNSATNLQTLDPVVIGVNGTLEITSGENLAAAGIIPVSKSLYVDLTALGYNMVDKPEGLALIDGGGVAVVNDNDFGLVGGYDRNSGRLELGDFPIVLGVVTFE